MLPRYLSALLFQVTPTDLATFVLVVALVGAVAIAATIVPALRAARVDPMLALRAD